MTNHHNRPSMDRGAIESKKTMDYDRLEIIGDYCVPCYATKTDCEVRIEELKHSLWTIGHCEIGKPTLTARYVVRKGKRRWYVHAEYHITVGTFGELVQPICPSILI